jgi:glycerophosphoryl diester phosphodiesterase
MGAVRNQFLDLLSSSRAHPVVVAHRGDSYHAPENTLEAARLALAAGAQAWELDVQLTRDGVPVVLHDSKLLRTTDVALRFAGDPRGDDGFRLCDFDFEEVRALDAGSWFVAPDGGRRSARAFNTFDQLTPSQIDLYGSGDVKVPSLSEALRFTADAGWLVNVEIKSFPGAPLGLVPRVFDVIAESGIASRVLVSSFDHHDLAALNVARRSFALGILTATPLFKTAEYATRLLGVETVHCSTAVVGAESVSYRRRREAGNLHAGRIAELQARAVPLLVYTVNDHGPGSLARHLAELEINGIFTDDPAALLQDLNP